MDLRLSAVLLFVVVVSSRALADAQYYAAAPAGAGAGAGGAALAPAAGAGAALAPATAVKRLPVPKKKVKVLPKKLIGPQPIKVKCKVANENPPFRVVTCEVASKLAVPVCPSFTCIPPPPGLCVTGPGAAGISNQACSWAITANCSIPTPIYPSRGNTWGFGWIFTEPGPVTIQLADFRRVGFQTTTC